MQRILNYYPNYPTHRLYFGEVETPYITDEHVALISKPRNGHRKISTSVVNKPKLSFLFIFYLFRCIQLDFPSISYQASSPFLSYWNRTTIDLLCINTFNNRKDTPHEIYFDIQRSLKNSECFNIVSENIGFSCEYLTLFKSQSPHTHGENLLPISKILNIRLLQS